MFWLRNKKIKFSLHTLNQSPDVSSCFADCFLMLRQAVNQRFKVQNLMVELQEKTGSITDEMRIETNKQGTVLSLYYTLLYTVSK